MNSFILPIDRTLKSPTALEHTGNVSNGNRRVHNIPQTPEIDPPHLMQFHNHILRMAHNDVYIYIWALRTHLLTLLRFDRLLRAAIFVPVCFLLSSSPAVLSSSLLGRWIMAWPHFHRHIICLLLSRHFPFITRCSLKIISEQRLSISTARVERFSLTEQLISNLKKRYGDLIETTLGLRFTSGLIALRHTDWNTVFPCV